MPPRGRPWPIPLAASSSVYYWYSPRHQPLIPGLNWVLRLYLILRVIPYYVVICYNQVLQRYSNRLGTYVLVLATPSNTFYL
jgi:hypothetical protein